MPYSIELRLVLVFQIDLIACFIDRTCPSDLYLDRSLDSGAQMFGARFSV